jgi:hypothetical protein
MRSYSSEQYDRNLVRGGHFILNSDQCSVSSALLFDLLSMQRTTIRTHKSDSPWVCITYTQQAVEAAQLDLVWEDIQDLVRMARWHTDGTRVVCHNTSRADGSSKRSSLPGTWFETS